MSAFHCGETLVMQSFHHSMKRARRDEEWLTPTNFKNG
jgi:hypothetical protein